MKIANLFTIAFLLLITQSNAQNCTCNDEPVNVDSVGLVKTSSDYAKGHVSNITPIKDCGTTFHTLCIGKDHKQTTIHDLGKEYWGRTGAGTHGWQRFFPDLGAKLNTAEGDLQSYKDWIGYNIVYAGSIVVYGQVYCRKHSPTTYWFEIDWEDDGDIFISKGLDGNIYRGTFANLRLLIADDAALVTKLDGLGIKSNQMSKKISNEKSLHNFTDIIMQYDCTHK